MNWIASVYMGSKGAKIIGQAQAFLSGKKTYIVAFTAFVTALANLINQFCSLPNAVSFVEWARHLTGNQDAVVLWHSLMVMTLRAGIAKGGTVAPSTAVANAHDGPQ